jgi:hypothetical protein
MIIKEGEEVQQTSFSCDLSLQMLLQACFKTSQSDSSELWLEQFLARYQRSIYSLTLNKISII